MLVPTSRFCFQVTRVRCGQKGGYTIRALLQFMEVESMRVRRWMLAFLVLTFLTLVAATAAQQGNDTPIAQNSEAKNFHTVPNVPDCFTAAVQQGDPAGSSSVLLIKGKAG